jgi:sialate O-acetylesterase
MKRRSPGIARSIAPHLRRFRVAILFLAVLVLSPARVGAADAAVLRVHRIFGSNMVLQRDKPVMIWGWASPGRTVTVQLGDERAEAAAAAGTGRWEVTLPAQPANATAQKLRVVCGDEKVELENILVGDVWVLSGQSNMAFPLEKVFDSDLEAAQANLPLLRLFSIDPNEQSEPQDDIPAEKIATQGWAVSTPETAGGFSAIGYVFASRLQRALGIPIGVIKTARGGASIEAIVPSHKFDDHPLAKRYAEGIRKKVAEFDLEATSLTIWSNQLARARSKNLPEDKWPKKPVQGDNLTSWDIPGKRASDMGSVHHGMFGVFKGYNIKGVLFHQGFNNALFSNSRPKFYRVLMKLMVEGWREDFHDPALPVGVIEFCAGGVAQNEENFEAESFAAGPYIREAQRLGLADVGDAKNTAFIPGYDVQIPGLHPSKKREHGERAARWALARIYQHKGMWWDTVALVSAEPRDDEMILTFNKRVEPDNKDSVIRGFAIAGEDGKFYLAHARHRTARESGGRLKADQTVIHVWSPLVAQPVAVRYAWATSPLGNLKVSGHPALACPSFRTDTWDLPANEEDFSVGAVADYRTLQAEASARCEFRRAEEARRAVEILPRLKSLGTVK